MTTIDLGYAIPDTLDELRAYWGQLHQLELIGYRPRKRRFSRQTTLTTWQIVELPARVRWECDVECEAIGYRYDNGPFLYWDDTEPIYMLPDDTLILNVRAGA